MAVQTITYGDKQFLNQNVDIPATNKVQDTDMNEIKSVVNNNATETNTNTNDIANILNAEIYSTNEIKTNKVWIDGKPIYRKVIDLGTLGNKKSINVEGDYDVITDFDGYIYQSSGAKSSLVEFASTSLYRAISYSKLSNNNLSIIINRSNTSSWSDWQLKIIIEYTKPTN